MKFHFADIENQTITEGYTTVVINDHEAVISPLKVTRTIDGKEKTEEIEDSAAILLAEKHGGVLQLSSEKKTGPAISGKRTQQGPTLKPGDSAELVEDDK